MSGNDIREIGNETAKLGGSLTWKLAMWGTSRDRKLLEKVDVRLKEEEFDSLKALGIEEPHQGLELRTSAAATKEEIEHHPELAGKKILIFEKLRNIGHIFAFPPSALGVIQKEECYVRKGRAKLPIAVSSPPHLVVDASRRFAVFSDEFIAIPPRQIGIAGKVESATALRALSLYLSSDFFRYHQFFNAPKWGVDESIADLETLKLAPIPVVRISPAELSDWAELQNELAALSKRQFEVSDFGANEQPRLLALLSDLNNRVFKQLGLRPTERWLVEDFVQIHLQLNKGKVTREAIRRPNPEECQVYLAALRDCLDGFLSAERGLRHEIEVLTDRDSALLSVSLVRSRAAIDPAIHNADEPASRDLKVIRDRLRSKHSQWLYFDRDLKVYDRKRGVLYQFKPLQRLHWTAPAGRSGCRRDHRRYTGGRRGVMMNSVDGDTASILLHQVYATELRIHAITLIWLGYRRLNAVSLAKAEEDDITGELVREMELVGEDPSSPDWVEQCEVHEQTRQNVADKRGKDRPIIDIEIRRHLRGPRARLRFEAKRLGFGHTLSAYLGDDGIAAFFSGYYPTTHGEAGMLGYVQEHTIGYWSDKLSQELSGDLSKHRIAEGGQLQSCNPEPAMPAFRSGHADAKGKLLLVIHVLLSFAG